MSYMPHQHRLWHRHQQLICRGRVLQAQKVLQHLSCQLQVMFSACHHVQPQLIQGIPMSLAESTRCNAHLTSIGTISSMNSWNPTSRVVHGSPHRLMIYACSAGKSPKWTIKASIRYTPRTTSLVSCRRRWVDTGSVCARQQHGCSMEPPIGSGY